MESKFKPGDRVLVTVLACSENDQGEVEEFLATVCARPSGQEVADCESRDGLLLGPLEGDGEGSWVRVDNFPNQVREYLVQETWPVGILPLAKRFPNAELWSKDAYGGYWEWSAVELATPQAFGLE